MVRHATPRVAAGGQHPEAVTRMRPGVVWLRRARSSLTQVQSGPGIWSGPQV
ncbi:predicted protein [Streptomyces viridosporus ATCC 14672]|uniref:Predicted protein n=1 Tax=Streptomyces viridosporus (strain ATCC 14672 / DSM 40746 / JCM 4963 / KCTC 9882 / NRRL B-12104 / FH 1290) TaxID=566461 RepID=D6A6X4_STRV1|nr:predicted protein [Streptomyces viridosporus ATCC 14672]